MAESLQCPSCGARTRVGSPPPDTITCGRCGRRLKLSASSASGVAPPPRTRPRGAAPVSPSPVTAGADAPPPRRRRGSADAGTGMLNVSSMPAGAGPVVIGAAGTAPAPTRRRVGSTEGPSRLVRILVWVVALPIALVAVGIPARKAGYLTGQKLLDVIVKHDLGRFVPLLVIVALWALVTAILVTLFLAAVERLSHGAEPAPRDA